MAGVPAADAAHQLTTVWRLVQAAVVVAVQVARQHPFAAELMDGGRRHTELGICCGALFLLLRAEFVLMWV